jgi:aarF domain-containing kinase
MWWQRGGLTRTKPFRHHSAWTGDESVRDAVIRLLMDKHKPLRTGSIRSADSRLQEMAKKTDMSPRVVVPSDETQAPFRPLSSAIMEEREIPAEDFKPWHARYVRTSSATTPQVYYGKSMPVAGSSSRSTVSLLDRPPLPTDAAARRSEKAKRRAEDRINRVEGAKEFALDYKLGGGGGYQMRGASAAGGGIRGGPSGLRAWQNLVEDRIEVSGDAIPFWTDSRYMFLTGFQKARSAGWFNDVKGRGKPICEDPDQHNPHIGV